MAINIAQSPFWKYQAAARAQAEAEVGDPSEAYVLGVMARMQSADFHQQIDPLRRQLVEIHMRRKLISPVIVLVPDGTGGLRHEYREAEYSDAEMAAIATIEGEIKRIALAIYGRDENGDAPDEDEETDCIIHGRCGGINGHCPRC